jgi:hypothetical protein
VRDERPKPKPPKPDQPAVFCDKETLTDVSGSSSRPGEQRQRERSGGKLNRSESDSSVPLPGSTRLLVPFDRNSLERRSLRWKPRMPSRRSHAHRLTPATTPSTDDHDDQYRTLVDIEVDLSAAKLQLRKQQVSRDLSLLHHETQK